MAKKKQKEPEHAPRDYAYIRKWAAFLKWGPEQLIETQQMAADERQPLDVVFYDYGTLRWFTTGEIKTPDARTALGLPALILVCPECSGDNAICTACGAVYQIRRGLGLCEQERCLATTGALECGNGVCRKVVSFSGEGVIVIPTKGDKDAPVLRPCAERVDGAPAETTEAG